MARACAREAIAAIHLLGATAHLEAPQSWCMINPAIWLRKVAARAGYREAGA